MTLRNIIQPDNPLLRRKARRVVSFDRRFQRLVDDMLETMQEAKGIGLAAPQLGVSQRVFVVCLPDDSEEAREEFGADAGAQHIIVNPKLVRVSRVNSRKALRVACPSRAIVGDVRTCRSPSRIKGQDRHGAALRIRADGWLARVFQHELDHLNGVLYIDIATDVRRAGGQAKTSADAAATQTELARPGRTSLHLCESWRSLWSFWTG